MSMWISSVKQLEPVRHLLNPLLLDFMEAAWPSSISMVIPRGECKTVCGCVRVLVGFFLLSSFFVSCFLTQARGWKSLVWEMLPNTLGLHKALQSETPTVL